MASEGTNDTKYSGQTIDNRTYDDSAGIRRVTLFPAYSKRLIETPDANTTYVGVASPGTSMSAKNAWILEKIDTSVTNTTSITHATDSWDNRATATYQ